ncbi:MAG: aminotransferase class I/II-fold pyridoxal phosphate-dependent enzyme [Candidatus Acidiferrum sp.]
MLEEDSVKILLAAVEKLNQGFSGMPAFTPPASDLQKIADVISVVAAKLQDNYPYFHPLYAGQMLKPPHSVAQLAYSLAQQINPNNHALDGGRASSAMEKEAVAEIARMCGWNEHLGHLTGGGTMANLEALWVAGQLAPGKTILASDQAHYTHQRVSGVLKLPFESIPCDTRGRMDVDALRKRLSGGDVGTVVATMGTTATGSVDPLVDILELREEYGFRVHSDAAYGGYFTLARNLDRSTRAAFDQIARVDSIVIDPHKHGLQPYGCGCVLFHDPDVGRLYKHDSPYTYFSSKQLHLGEISLECSRPGAAAVALWATQRLLPLENGGEFAQGLEEGREAGLEFYARLRADDRFVTAFAPELDIVIFLPQSHSVSLSAARSRQIFEAAALRNLHLAVAELPLTFFAEEAADLERDSAGTTVTCLRSVLMKAQHKQWMPRIWDILDTATNEVLRTS